jgi:CDP-2,3-bis-(O-geranylgeranyl)-sn-glycerol synthase
LTTVEQLVSLGIEGFLLYLPALIANAGALIFGGGTPIDLGKKFIDGQPILGKNKTYRGLIGGLCVGTLTGIITKTALFGFLISLGGLLGDMMGAFIKRRLGIKPGNPLPILDQYDFILGASIFIMIIQQETAIRSIIIVLILTPIIHVIANVFSYVMKIKTVPW